MALAVAAAYGDLTAEGQEPEREPNVPRPEVVR